MPQQGATTYGILMVKARSQHSPTANEKIPKGEETRRGAGRARPRVVAPTQNRHKIMYAIWYMETEGLNPFLKS